MLHLLRHLFDRNSLALKTVDAEIGCNVEKKIENQKTNNILFKNANDFGFCFFDHSQYAHK